MDLLHNYRMRRKYNNIPKRYNGRLFDSTLEADFAQVLDLMKKAGEIKIIEEQPKYRLEVYKHHICNIIPDFYVVDKDGKECIYEVKGKETSEWRYKWKLMQALYPQYEYKVIKRGDFSLYKDIK